MPTIQAISPAQMELYASVPISFRVEKILRLETIASGLGGLRLVEEPVAEPYLKDYDALAGSSPLTWAQQFNLSNWGFFLAREADSQLGAAAVAWNTDGVDMLEGGRDTAVLWDLRVQPAWRGCGIGRHLFLYAADWARQRGCRRLKIETQNINVEACRFYARMGCELGGILKYAYLAPEVEREAMLLWYLVL